MSSNGTATPTSDPPSSTQTTPAQPSSSLTEPSSTVTTPDPPPTSTPVDIPSTSPPPADTPTSTPQPESTTTTTPPPSTTQTTTASTRPAATTTLTSVITPTATSEGETLTPITSVVTKTIPGDTTIPTDANGPASPTSSSDPASLQSPSASKSQGGLSTGGKTAIAVVVPVVVVALLVIAGILLWRRRKSKKNDAEARRKEVEEYGFNPNNDPTLPAVGMTNEMAEDQSGYRGWGNTTASSHAKGSTTLASGNTYSDGGSNPGGYQSPGSPTQGTYSDGHSSDPLVHGRRETLDSDGIGALGAAPVANNQGGVHRGPSNASSSYSAADRSDNSGDYPIPVNNPQEYYENGNNGYYHATSPYDNNAYPSQQQPVIRDVSARRNTRIENPSVFPQQGNSGIAQNF